MSWVLGLVALAGALTSEPAQAMGPIVDRSQLSGM
jgi:hypothetical protein